jgi:hypothetical protein
MCDGQENQDLYFIAQKVRGWIRAEYARAESIERREQLLTMRIGLSRHLEKQASTFEELRRLKALHETQFRCLLVSEASTLSGSVNKLALREITEREVHTGRMKPTDELYVRAKAKLDVLCLVQPISPHEFEEAIAKGVEEPPSSEYLQEFSIS